MSELSVSETQLERLEEISEELEAVYVGEYGAVRPTDTLQYLLDTYTPPESTESDRTPADIDGLTSIDGVGEATAKSLAIAGFRSVDEVAGADAEALAEIKGIGREQAVDIVAAATEVDADQSNENNGGDHVDSTAESNPDIDREAASPESTLQQAMDLLDAHGDRWRESSGDEPYEVDLPNGSTEAVRTRDDVKRLLFKHWR